MLLGVSGSGKGSVAERLLDSGLIAAHASMGGWLREALEQPSTVNQRLTQEQPDGFATPLEYLRHCVKNGLLIPDAWTQAVIETRLGAITSGTWALDGYPRTVGAARHLIAALEGHAIPLLGAVELQISPEVMSRRLLARGRFDDHETAIGQRLEFYRQSVQPTLVWLEDHGVPVHRVDAAADLETVTDRVADWLRGVRV